MPSTTYTNPIYPADFPDPFVLRWGGRYYAYGTGPAVDGKQLRMLSSDDLVHWVPHGGVLEPLDLPGAEEYWAPEVAYHEGTFYLYYATGRTDDPDHHLRVAVARNPLGPWRDAGLNLTPHEIFAIDAHPFRDPVDGQWYLFYANDVLQGPYAGTGIVVDRLLAMDRLEGNPRPVLRPFAEWQLFELQRAVKQNLDWYTIEGPFVRRVGERYICFYSGGRWENPNYGVGFAVADHPLGPWRDAEHGAGPSILKTIPGEVIGPGHNSVVRGPDLVTDYIVYHGWDPGCTARYPRIDRLTWEDGRPLCDGPSFQPRPRPHGPDLLLRQLPNSGWTASGTWENATLGVHPLTSAAELRLDQPLTAFVAELSVVAEPGAAWSLCLGELSFTAPAPYPTDLLLRRTAARLQVLVDGRLVEDTPAPPGPLPLSLRAGPGATFRHLALTRL